MSIVRTDLRETRERARELRFEPTGALTQTNVQKAIEQSATQPQAVTATAITVAQSPYAVKNTDSFLAVDTVGGPIQILLQAQALRLGVPLSIKDVTGHAAANNITITPNGIETVDSLAPYPINADFGGIRIVPEVGGYTVAP